MAETRQKFQLGPETKRVLGEIRSAVNDRGYCLPNEIIRRQAAIIQDLQHLGLVAWGKGPNKVMTLLITDEDAVSELLDGFIPVRMADYGPRLRTSLLAS
jgi:hypothetical protein